jgi:hypothetical protein
MTMHISIQLLALEHCWSISTENYLTTFITVLISLLPPVYLPEKLVGITALKQ